jgi:hypothetical protein
VLIQRIQQLHITTLPPPVIALLEVRTPSPQQLLSNLHTHRCMSQATLAAVLPYLPAATRTSTRAPLAAAA